MSRRSRLSTAGTEVGEPHGRRDDDEHDDRHDPVGADGEHVHDRRGARPISTPIRRGDWIRVATERIDRMTTLVDRPNTALLIVDVQHGNTGEAHDREAVIARINTLLDHARRTDTPVVWVQHADEHLVEGSPQWQYADELTRDDSEPLVHKHFGDAFEETDLEDVLAERQVGRIVVTGASTDMCIRATLHGAMARGYDATLVGDAHTLEDPSKWGLPFNAEQVIAFTNSYWDEAAAPGRVGGTVAAADVDFTPSS
jgi:isochorismate hydrolase